VADGPDITGEYDVDVDWSQLRAAAVEAMRRAYAPYSNFPVGVAGLVDDGRIVVGCNVENASYGLGLCAECAMVSTLHLTGGGRLVAVACVDGRGEPLTPCGRCRQLLWEHGGPTCLVDSAERPVPMAELLPGAFGPDDLDRLAAPPTASLPGRLREWYGRGAVFVHPDADGGLPVWTAYWERSDAFTDTATGAEPGILEEGPNFPAAADAVAWGLARTPRVVVVNAAGTLCWAGAGDPPAAVPQRWEQD
jgi:cytidine deaminase